MLSPAAAGGDFGRLAAIPHIESLRIHTRVPVADPGRVMRELVGRCARRASRCGGGACQSCAGFSPGALAALARLAEAGVPLLGQSVLLRGVNDIAAALEGLFRAMLAARVKPYYLHALDAAPGTARFAVPDAEGLALMRRCAGGCRGMRFRRLCGRARGAAGRSRSRGRPAPFSEIAACGGRGFGQIAGWGGGGVSDKLRG